MNNFFNGKSIIVNATATKYGGALTILQQFIDNISVYDKRNSYIIFSGAKLNALPANVLQVRFTTVSYIERIRWDFWKLNKYLKKNNILADKIISFQNTGVRTTTCPPQILYYHNPIALFPYHWSFFKKNERPYFIYKYLYPIIVKFSLKFVDVTFVQLPFIKQKFQRLYGVKSEKVIVERPYVPNISIENVQHKSFNDNFFHIIYPASPFLHKNHIELVNALNYLKQGNVDSIKKIRIHLTNVDTNNALDLIKKIQEYNLMEQFIFEGSMSEDTFFSLLGSSDLLVFPSFIETFGLPLIEGAMFGLPILVTDSSYSKEVLRNYKNVKFLPIKNPQAWGDAILKESDEKNKGREFLKWDMPTAPWQLFFDEILKDK